MMRITRLDKLQVCVLMLAACMPIAHASAQTLNWQQSTRLGITGVQKLIARGDGAIASLSASGIHVSVDFGETWVHRPLPFDGVLTIAFDSTGGMYVGGHGSPTAIFARSTDLGLTWTSMRTYPGRSAAQIAIGPDGQIYVGGPSSALTASYDNGATWKTLGLSSVGGLAVRYDGLMIASRLTGPREVVRSDRQGREWSVSTGGTGRLITSVAFQGLSAVYITVLDEGAQRQLLRSDNGGASYTYVPSPQPYCVTTVGTTLLIGTVDDGIHRSVDNGRTWQRVDIACGSGRQITAMGSKVFVIGSTGPFLSSDGGTTWERRVEWVAESSLRSVSLGADGSMVAVGSGSGVFRSTDDLFTWSWIGHGSFPYNGAYSLELADYAIATRRGTVFSAPTIGKLTRRDTSGEWGFVYAPGVGEPLEIGHAMAASKSGEIALATNDGALYVSNDEGLTLERVDGQSSLTRPAAMTYADNGRLWIADDAGVFVRDPGASSFQRARSSADLLGKPRICALGPNNELIVVLAFDGAQQIIWRADASDPSGEWSTLPLLPDARSISGAVVGTDGTVYVSVRRYLTNRSSVFALSPGADTWRDVGPAFIDNSIVGMVMLNDGRIAIGTEQRGVYVTTARSSAQDAMTPRSHAALSTRYDATNDAVTVRASVPRAARYRMTLYDARGRDVCILFDEVLDAGETTVGVGLSSIASGAYVLVFDGDGVRAHEMVRVAR